MKSPEADKRNILTGQGYVSEVKPGKKVQAQKTEPVKFQSVHVGKKVFVEKNKSTFPCGETKQKFTSEYQSNFFSKSISSVIKKHNRVSYFKR